MTVACRTGPRREGQSTKDALGKPRIGRLSSYPLPASADKLNRWKDDESAIRIRCQRILRQRRTEWVALVS